MTDQTPHQATDRDRDHDHDHDEAMAELFRQDPAFAAEYLNQLRHDGEAGDIQVALRQIAQSDHQAWLIAQVQAGIAEADRGEFASDAQVKALFAKYAD